MDTKKLVALALADTLLAGAADLSSMIANTTSALGQKWPWIPSLCKALRRRTRDHFYHFTRMELAELILTHHSFENAWKNQHQHPRIVRYCLQLPVAVEPPAWLAALALPSLATSADLAQWLNVIPSDLDWFADKWRTSPAQPAALHHYRYRWVKKHTGGLRLIEMPKQSLRTIQRRILDRLLNRVPPHSAAHGFRCAHSCVTHAAIHSGKRVVIKMDLKNFFPSIAAARIHALFTKLGYAHSVAGTLTRLCTHRTPNRILNDPAIRATVPAQQHPQFRTPHLPQGAPTSPALANLCTYRLDLRLDALAQSLGARYSRYADDLAFSGDHDLEQAVGRFQAQVAAIAREEGFTIHPDKTRVMHAGTRQQVTGIVVNRHPNIYRSEYDTLKAILTNCIRHGAHSQNRDRHHDYRAFLTGKIAHVRMVNPQRAMRLSQLFEKIVWQEEFVASVP
jgi:RNA-directed DNA polymerase